MFKPISATTSEYIPPILQFSKLMN